MNREERIQHIREEAWSARARATSDTGWMMRYALDVEFLLGELAKVEQMVTAEEKSYGALARANALIAGVPEFWKVTEWPEPPEPLEARIRALAAEWKALSTPGEWSRALHPRVADELLALLDEPEAPTCTCAYRHDGDRAGLVPADPPCPVHGDDPDEAVKS